MLFQCVPIRCVFYKPDSACAEPREHLHWQIFKTGAVGDTLPQKNDKELRPSRDINQDTISDRNRQSLTLVSTGPSGISIKCGTLL